jgi:hypothetical protein
MVDLMEGPSFFHPNCMEETGTQSQEVLYEGQSPSGLSSFIANVMLYRILWAS